METTNPSETVNSLPQELVFHILSLYELGLPPETIQRSLCQTYQVEVSLMVIGRLTGRMDCLIDEWLNQLRPSINSIP